jgi:DNA mismatch repair protein MutH
VNRLKAKIPPNSESDLIQGCLAIEGLTFAQLASGLSINIPENPLQRKGWLGQAIELALGTTAKNRAEPDFKALGIELKTIPIAKSGKPAESTFVTSIPLLTIHKQQWATSQCFSKLKRVVWIPVEGDRDIPYHHRRIGSGFIWSPTINQTLILARDWTDLTTMISTGQLEALDAREGEYLQVRPKAANSKSLCFAYDAEGNKIQTLPRGFYLRSTFTAQLL